MAILVSADCWLCEDDVGSICLASTQPALFSLKNCLAASFGCSLGLVVGFESELDKMTGKTKPCISLYLGRPVSSVGRASDF